MPRHPENRRARASSAPGFDSRIAGTRCGCTALCKEQAGNREHSSAPFSYIPRLVPPALMPRTIAVTTTHHFKQPISFPRRVFACCPHAEEPRSAGRMTQRAHTRVRCAASRSMRVHPICSSSSFETRARLVALAAPSRMRAPQDEDEQHVPNHLLMLAPHRIRDTRTSDAFVTPIHLSNSQSCSFPRRISAPGFASWLRSSEYLL
jgi:hypothetical protein